MMASVNMNMQIYKNDATAVSFIVFIQSGYKVE